MKKIHHFAAPFAAALLLATGAQAGTGSTAMGQVAQEQVSSYAISPAAEPAPAARWSDVSPHAAWSDPAPTAASSPAVSSADAAASQVASYGIAPSSDLQVSTAPVDESVAALAAAEADEPVTEETLAYQVISEDELSAEEVAYLRENLQPGALVVLDGQEYYVYWEEAPSSVY